MVGRSLGGKNSPAFKFHVRAFNFRWPALLLSSAWDDVGVRSGGGFRAERPSGVRSTMPSRRLTPRQHRHPAHAGLFFPEKTGVEVVVHDAVQRHPPERGLSARAAPGLRAAGRPLRLATMALSSTSLCNGWSTASTDAVYSSRSTCRRRTAGASSVQCEQLVRAPGEHRRRMILSRFNRHVARRWVHAG